MDFNTRSRDEGPSGPPPGPTVPRNQVEEFDIARPIGSFVRTLGALVGRPVGFYRDLYGIRGLLDPLCFSLIAFAIPAVISAVVSAWTLDGGAIVSRVGLVGAPGYGQFYASGMAMMTPFVIVLGAVAAFVFAMLVGVVFLFLASGVLHLLLRVLTGGENGPFIGTFRAVAYTSAAGLLIWIPYVGWAINLYGLVLVVLGLREIHRISTGLALLTVIIPSVVATVLFGLLFLLLRVL